MVTLDEIRQPIEERIGEFETFVRKSFNEREGTLLAEMIEYILSSRGKGLRPIVVMLAAQCVRPSLPFGQRTMLAAMLTEMIHTASLVHDDVIDESNLRRGRASVNARWQSRNAVIVGDYILARNMNIGLKSGQFDLLNHIIGSMSILCEGELLQSDHAAKLDINREAYFDIIYKKTASLFGTAASAGALSVGGSHDQISAMRDYGEALGMAFQIVDDILDYTPDAATGKPSANDLRERKITLPLIEVLAVCSEEERSRILALVEQCNVSDEAVEEVRQWVEQGNGVAAARKVLQRFLQRAMSALNSFDESPAREALLKLCCFVAERDR